MDTRRSTDTFQTRTARSAAGIGAIATALLLLLAPGAAAQDDGGLDEPVMIAAAGEQDGPIFPIDRLELRYLRENPLHPPIESLMALTVTLGRTDSGYVAPREGIPAITISLQEISDRPQEMYHASAIQWILERVRDELLAQGLLGVYVAPDPRQISEIGLDIRPAGNADLTIVITTGIVTELRTIGSGERVREGGDIEPADRIDNPKHARIIERSPVRPSVDGEVEQRDLLRKDELDRYLFFLGRHPGRRVDASVAAAEDIGGIALDYLVTENKPLTLYAQVSNTGTPQTNRWRERFGFFHTQLTNNDDILSVDYSTAGFDASHAFVGSYEAPFPNDRVRWRVQGGYNEYTASEVGFFSDIFKGDSWTVGGEIAWNFYQKREFFLDLVGGVRFDNVHVDNQAFLIEGEGDFLMPYVGLRFERTTEWLNTEGGLTLEFQTLNNDSSDLNSLGRTDPDDHWQVLRFAFSNSVFLEPLFNRKGWEDPTTPESSTLAHELLLSFQGQYAFENRLIPQYQQVVGGLYTVRGYPQSVVAGDSAFIGTVEYRFHVPRSFAVQPEPRRLFGDAFRVAPQYVYGVPDWDLVLKGFVDVGRTLVSDPFFFEEDYTLVGAGIGLDFLYKRNISIRLDWGFALEEIEDRDVNSGSNRLHFVATLMF